MLKTLKYISGILFLLFCAAHTCFAQQYTVVGGIGTPYGESPGSLGTGIEKIYFFNTLAGATMSHTSSAASVLFYRYTNSLADAELISSSDITTSISGSETTYTVHNLQDSRGYYAQENGSPKNIIWIIDYTQHLPQLNSITTDESDDRCFYLKLLIDKSDELLYYSVSGSPISVSRKYTISYPDMKWVDADMVFENTEITMDNMTIGTETVIDAPFKDTRFTLTGDQYAELLGLSPQSITSVDYTAIATSAHIKSELDTTTSLSNMPGTGESAPAHYTFYGLSNEPTTQYFTWYIYNTNDLVNYIVRYTDRDISYTFDTDGTYRIVFEVSNSSDNYECLSRDSIDISVSETYLEAPNFFSPVDSPGQNDEFKVAYRSIKNFRCTIFNRWGNKLYEWADPSKGWDGRYKGKYVNPGVYFYVIEYEDSKGQKKVAKGSVSIIRSK